MKPYAEKNSDCNLYTNLPTNLIIKMPSEILKYQHFRRHFAIPRKLSTKLSTLFFKTGFHPKYSGLTKIRTRRRSRRQYK
ncbi:hypothetical protein COH50_08145 [Neisseria meningitidis]|nr:hypothetical protein COH50_08145 [Neisseria meningitidis]